MARFSLAQRTEGLFESFRFVHMRVNDENESGVFNGGSKGNIP